MEKRIIDPEKLRAFKQTARKFNTMPLLCEWLDDWFTRFILYKRRKSTIINYASYIHKHINPILGDYGIDELEPAMIQFFVQDQLENGRIDRDGGLSEKTVLEYRNMLFQALQKAVEEGYIISNPCQFVHVKKTGVKEIRTLTMEEEVQIHQKIDCQWKPASLIPALLGLYGGMRIGEIAGLKLGDVDLEKRQLHISRTLNRFTVIENEKRTSQLRYGTTKNGKERTIPLNDDLYEALSIYIGSMPDELRKEDGPLFITRKRTVMEPRMIGYHFQKLMKQLQIENIHFHCLRHTFATRALEANMNIKVCSKILGHSSTKITSDIYTHVSFQQMMREIKKLNLQNLERIHA